MNGIFMVLVGKYSINWGLSIAMFDYQGAVGWVLFEMLKTEGEVQLKPCWEAVRETLTIYKLHTINVQGFLQT